MKMVYWIAALFFSINLAWATPAEVESQVKNLTEAMIKADAGALEKLTSKHLNYGHSSGKVEDQQAFIHALTSGASDFITIELKNQTISVADNVAIVRHELLAETNDSGNPGNVKIGVLLIWQQEAGGWKLLARQAYKI